MHEEHRFWLKILSDHLVFIHEALAPEETETLTRVRELSNQLKNLWDTFENTSINNLGNEEHQAALNLAFQIRELKLNLLKRQIAEKIKISLPPTFINHMLNEIDEYISIIEYYIQTGTIKVPDAIDLHLLWLPDAEGHAASVKSQLDPVEKHAVKKLKQLKKKFNALFCKAVEFKGFTRALSDFPARRYLDDEVNNEMNIFIRLLNEIRDLRFPPQLLGTIQPLMLDHMIMEEQYYLSKLAMT